MELVQIGDKWEWQPRKDTPNKGPEPYKGPEPVVTSSPIKVVDTPGITISEFFGTVASKSTTASFALATVHRPDEAGFQVPSFAEYVIVNSGSLDLQTISADGCRLTKTHVTTGQGVYLPAGLR
eukprot:3971788-Prymnesium_polylepis.1